MAEPDIRLLIGAKGGASPSGSSAVEIRQALQSALSGKNGVKVNIRLTSNAADNLRQEIQKALNASGGIEVKLKGKITDAISASNTTITSNSTSNGALVSTKAMSQATALITQEKIKQLSLDKELNRTYQEQIKSQQLKRQEIQTTVAQAKAEYTQEKLESQRSLDNTKKQTAEINAQAASIRANTNLKRAEANAQKQLTTENEKTARAVANCASAQANFNQYLKTVNPKGLREYAVQISEINRLFKEGNLAEAQNRVKELQASFRNLGYEGGNVVTYLQSKIKALFTYLVANRVMMVFASSIREAVQAVKDIDAELTQMQIVTGATDAKMSKFLDGVAEKAKNVASSITDMISSGTVYARLGYDLEDASTLAEYTAMLQNVGNIDVSDAQNAITAIVKAYNVGVSDIEQVMDKLVTVGNRFPISVSELAEGMNNAGSALASAGNSFEQSLALLAAANTTVQNISKSSTGLRTIAARIRNTKTQLDELGEAMTESEYDELVRALTKANVSLVDTNGELRSTYDILKDISLIYNDMSANDKAALSELLAGNRQQNILASVLTQFQEASGAMEAMTNSMGAMATANATYMESVGAKADRMKAAFQEMANTIIDSNLIGMVYDVGTAFAEFLTLGDGFVAKAAIITAAILGISAAVSALKASSIGSFFASIAKIPSTLSTIGAVSSVFASGMQNAASSTAILTKAFSTLTTAQIAAHVGFTTLSEDQFINALDASTLSEKEKELLFEMYLAANAANADAAANAADAAAKGVNITATERLINAFKGLLATILANPYLAIGAAIAGVIAGIVLYQKHQEEVFKEAIENAKELQEEYQNVTKTLSDNVSKVSELEVEFNKLASGVDNNGKNISLTNDEYSRYLEIVNDLVDINPGLVRGYNSEGQAIINKNSAIAETIELLKEQQKLELYKATTPEQNWAILEGVSNEYIQAERNLIGAKSDYEFQLRDSWVNLQESIRNELKNSGNYDASGNLTSILGLNPNELRSRLIQAFQLNEEDFGAAEFADSWQRAFATIQNAINSADPNYGFVTNYAESYKELIDLLDPNQISAINNAQKSFVLLNNQLDRASLGYQSQLQRIAQASSGYDELSEGAQAFISQWISTMKIGGSETEKTAQEMTNSLQSMITLLTDGTNDNSKILQEKMNALFSLDFSKMDAQQYNEWVAVAEDAIASIQEILGYYGKSLSEEEIAAIRAKIGLTLDFEINGQPATRESLIAEVKSKVESMGWDSSNIDQLDLGVLKFLFTADFSQFDSTETAIDAYNTVVATAATESNNLKTALASLTDETAILQTAMEKLSDGSASFDEWFGGEDGQKNLENLLKVFPNLQDELEAYESGVISATDLQKAFNGAINDFNTNQIYNGIKNVVDAYESYGASSNQVLQAIQNLEAYIPGITAALWNQENGYLQVANSAKFSAESILATAKTTLSSAKIMNGADFRTLLNSLDAVAQKALLAQVQFKATALMTEDIKYGIGVMSMDDYRAQAYNQLIKEQNAILNQVGTRIASDTASKSSKSSSKTVEEYTSDVEQFYEESRKLLDIQHEIELEKAKSALLDEEDYEAQKNHYEALIDLYRKEQNALHDLANARRAAIDANIATLQNAGFNVEYDSVNNNFLIRNIELLNTLEAQTQGTYGSMTEANNAYRKEMEGLIETTTGWVDANRDASVEYFKLSGYIKDSSDAINNLGKNGKEVEPYLSDAAQFYAENRKLLEIQHEIELENAKNALIDEKDFEAQKAHQETLVKLYKDEQDALHDLAEARRVVIDANITTLKDAGFDIEYDAENNSFFVKNMELLNTLEAQTQGAYDSMAEASNAYRQETESLIDSTTKLVDANREASVTWFELAENSKNVADEYTAEIDPFYKQLQKVQNIEDEIQRAGDKASLLDETDFNGKVNYHQSLIQMYQDEQVALHELAEARRDVIDANIEKLQGFGFGVEYDAENNRILIQNMEHINELDSVYRKEIEGIIDDTIDMVEANKNAADSWWELQSSIRSAKVDVVNTLKEIVENASKAVDSLQDVYETLHNAADEFAENEGFISVDTFQSLIDLGPQYMQYLQDENGLLVINEERINQVITAKTRQLALDSAISYITRLNLAAQEGSIEKMDQLCFATEKTMGATWDLVYSQLKAMQLSGQLTDAQYEAALHNIQAIRALGDTAATSVGAAVGSVSNKLSDMQSGLEDIIKYVMDMLKQQVNDEIDGIRDMVDQYDDLISKKKESLRASKEEANYQKTLSNKLKEIAKLQAKIDALSLDNSREAQAEKAKLLEQMAELQEDLADTQADKALEAQEDSLDKMADAYEEEKEDEIKVLENSISSYQKLYDKAIAYIGDHWDTLYGELIDWNTEYGSVLNDEITEAWNNCLLAAQKYGGSVSDMLASVKTDIEAINNSAANSLNTVVGVAGNQYKNENASVTGNQAQIAASMKQNSIAWWTASSSERANLETVQQSLADQYRTLTGDTGFNRTNDGIWRTGLGSPLYTLTKSDKDTIAKQIVSNMQAISAQWYAGIDSSTMSKLEDQQFEWANRLQMLLGQSVTRDHMGKWWIGNKELYKVTDFSVYHKGGVAGDMPTLKQNEIMAKLEKGEGILNDQKWKGLYTLIDTVDSLAGKFGSAISKLQIGNILQSSMTPNLALAGVPEGVPYSNQISPIQFGDNYFYGTPEETIKQHIELNSRLADKIFEYINPRR